jgi:nitric oxide dioxygenase/hemoglobin
MVKRHVETGVHAEHYPHVAAALLATIRDVLGAEVATDELLADILIAADAEACAEAV